MRHGVKFDMTPPIYGDTGSMSINDDVIPLNCDGEKRFLSMSKPTKDDLDLHDCYELSSALHTPAIHPSRRSKKTMHEDTPMIEWHRRLAMAPEDIVSKTLQHTTQHYLNVDCENRSNMHEHYQSLGVNPGGRFGAAGLLVDPSLPDGQAANLLHHFVVHPTWILSVKQENGLVNVPVGHWRAEFYTYAYIAMWFQLPEQSSSSKKQGLGLLRVALWQRDRQCEPLFWP